MILVEFGSKLQQEQKINKMASADSSFLSLLQEEIKCAFCLDQLKTPRALACLHSFCEKCLQKYEDQNRSPGRIACPVCQEETVLEDSGIAGLRRDFRAMALIERLEKEKKKQQEREEVPKTCEVCGNIDPKGTSSFVSCLQCEQTMCKQCGILHKKMKSSRNHTLTALSSSVTPNPAVSLQEPGNADNNTDECGLCEKHEEKKMDLFCITCLTPVCKECSLDDHRLEDNHECVPVGEYEPVMREEILSRLSKVPELSAEDNDIIDMVRHTEDFVKSFGDKAHAAFSRCTDLWRTDLDDKKGRFFHSSLQTVEKIRQKAKDHVDSLKKIQVKAKEVLMQNNRSCLSSTFKELQESLDTLLYDIPDRSTVEAISKTISQLQFQVNNESSVWSLVLASRERRNISIKSKSGPSALTFTGDERLAVSADFEGPSHPSQNMSYYENRGLEDEYYPCTKEVWNKCTYSAIKVTNTSYRVAVGFSMEQRLDCSCKAISSLSDLRFAVLHYESSKTGLYPRQDSKLSLLNEERSCILTTDDRTITDIVVDRKDNIYYSCQDPNQICIIRPNGTKKKDISTGDLKPLQVAVCPCSPDQILITHDSSKVSVIDRNGKLLRTITRPEWRDVAIRCDNRKLLYVLWKSEAGLRTLQRFTMEGHFLDTLFESERHGYPTLLLAVSPDGSAAVVTDGGSNGNVTVISTERKVDSYDA